LTSPQSTCGIEARLGKSRDGKRSIRPANPTMQRKSAKSASYMVAEFVKQKRRPASAGRFSLACIKIISANWSICRRPIASPTDAFGLKRGQQIGQIRRKPIQRVAETHNSNSYSDAVTDDSPQTTMPLFPSWKTRFVNWKPVMRR
jgi:hypothetical protein